MGHWQWWGRRVSQERGDIIVQLQVSCCFGLDTSFFLTGTPSLMG